MGSPAPNSLAHVVGLFSITTGHSDWNDADACLSRTSDRVSDVKKLLSKSGIERVAQAFEALPVGGDAVSTILGSSKPADGLPSDMLIFSGTDDTRGNESVSQSSPCDVQKKNRAFSICKWRRASSTKSGQGLPSKSARTKCRWV